MDIIINALLHSFILFVFLTIFYFFYIAPLIQSHLDVELKKAIESSIQDLLRDTENAKLFNIFSEKLKGKYTEEDPYKKNYNYVLERNVIIFILLFLMSIVLTYFLLTFYGYKVNLKFILLENILLFSIIGVMEYMFFIKIAYKYTVIYPSEVSQKVNERIRYNLQLNG